jgi:hypothetical protein
MIGMKGYSTSRSSIIRLFMTSRTVKNTGASAKRSTGRASRLPFSDATRAGTVPSAADRPKSARASRDAPLNAPFISRLPLTCLAKGRGSQYTRKLVGNLPPFGTGHGRLMTQARIYLFPSDRARWPRKVAIVTRRTRKRCRAVISVYSAGYCRRMCGQHNSTLDRASAASPPEPNAHFYVSFCRCHKLPPPEGQGFEGFVWQPGSLWCRFSTGTVAVITGLTHACREFWDFYSWSRAGRSRLFVTGYSYQFRDELRF